MVNPYRDPDTGQFISKRALERDLPRNHPANDNVQGTSTVGPNAVEGVGDTNVLYDPSFGPPPPESWSGWPVNWGTGWNNTTTGKAWLNRLDVVFTCLDKNSGPLSVMPPLIQKSGRDLGENYRSWLQNPEPLAYASWPEFMKSLVWTYQSCGEVFIVATSRYADGYPQRFVMVEPWLVDVDRVGGRITYQINQQQIDPADVLHIKYLSFPSDLRGHGPLEAAGARLLAAEALSRYAADLASNGGAPWAVLKATRTLTAAQAQKLQQQWINSRLRAGGAPAVLDNETDIEVLSGSPKDMMLSELAAFSEARLAVLLGVPPHLAGLPSGGDSLTYSTVAAQYDAHWRGTLRVMASTITSAMDNWLLPAGTHLEINADDYIQPDWLARAQTYQILVNIGVVTPGQVAQRERWLLPVGELPPVPETATVPTPTVPVPEGAAQ